MVQRHPVAYDDVVLADEGCEVRVAHGGDVVGAALHLDQRKVQSTYATVFTV